MKRIDYNMQQCHGFKADPGWKKPKLVVECEEANRGDQGNNTRSDEYLDDEDVLTAKVKIIASLIRESTCTTCYTGAGLSKSSGIPDYATKASNSLVKVKKISSSLDALPTQGHHVIAAMERASLVHHYVQQNHDGLPQKAGFPQKKLNEIHGSWYDVSNPVIQFSGNLRGDLFDWMYEMEQKTTLCLCLGTSLSGMNADRMATTPAKKAKKNTPNIQGTIVVNLQKTSLDKAALCTVRVWAKLDDFFTLLAKELSLQVDAKVISFPDYKNDVFLVPYDINGKKNNNYEMKLDLRPHARIKVNPKESSYYNKRGRIGIRNDMSYLVILDNHKYANCLGRWWIEDALKGEIDELPIINENPIVTMKKKR